MFWKIGNASSKMMTQPAKNRIDSVILPGNMWTGAELYRIYPVIPWTLSAIDI
jgi:hypothetical protein